MMTVHTDKQYEEELKTLKEEILKMGGVIEEMIAQSMKALVERESNIARQVLERDPEATGWGSAKSFKHWSSIPISR